jgi:hypothetical protein
MLWDYDNRSSLELLFLGILYCAIPLGVICAMAFMPGITFLRFIGGVFIFLASGFGYILFMGLKCWGELIKRNMKRS